MTTAQKISFHGAHNARLSARLDLPAGTVRAYALFAHCFTCSKDIFAARQIAVDLARRGIAVLRFDFTGLGSSDGEFASTDFSSNVGDLIAAVDFMRQNFEAPKILIGHSLGGAAVLAAAPDIPEALAVATIAAPADADHVIANFHAYLDRIEEAGEAEVELAGRRFTIRSEFLEDLHAQAVTKRLGKMKKALLVLHSPVDPVVDIDNAARIYKAAKHPKSFVSLDRADHLLSRQEDAVYAAEVIAAWASRYVDRPGEPEPIVDLEGAIVAETGEGRFQNVARVGRHRFFADEPEKAGGLDSGPSPYDFLSVALAACTSMTLRMYADFKKIALPRITVKVIHGKVHGSDCEDCGEAANTSAKIDRFERRISFDGDVDPDIADKIVEIANKCPVHRTLEHITESAVVTKLEKS